MTKQTVLTGIIIEETTVFTLGELSRACGKPAEWILALVEEGIIEPVGGDQSHWQFGGHCLRRVRAMLQRMPQRNPGDGALPNRFPFNPERI